MGTTERSEDSARRGSGTLSEQVGHSKIKRGSDRNFGIVFTVAFAVIGLLPLVHGGSPRLWCFMVAAAFLAVTLIYPRALRPLNIVWFWAGLILGKIVAPVVMTLLFLVAITPTALFLRMSGKDPMRRKFDPAAPSYWISRSEQQPMGTMKNQF